MSMQRAYGATIDRCVESSPPTPLFIHCSAYTQQARRTCIFCQWPDSLEHTDANTFSAIRSFTFLRTHTHPFSGPLSGTTRVGRYHKGKTNLDFTEARDSEWQWHQLGHMQVCTSLQTDNHASTSPVCFLQAGCPSCHPTNSVKALKAQFSFF